MLRFSGPDFLLPHGILTAAARAFPFSRHCGDVTLSRPLDTRSDMRCTDRWLERIFPAGPLLRSAGTSFFAPALRLLDASAACQ